MEPRPPPRPPSWSFPLPPLTRCSVGEASLTLPAPLPTTPRPLAALPAAADPSPPPPEEEDDAPFSPAALLSVARPSRSDNSDGLSSGKRSWEGVRSWLASRAAAVAAADRAGAIKRLVVVVAVVVGTGRGREADVATALPPVGPRWTAAAAAVG